MLDNFTTFLKKKGKKEPVDKSKNAAKERLHLVLMQDRANVSADFLEMMKQEIVDVVKKYIDVDETDMDVKLENRVNNDGTSGAPALYANIPIMGINEEKKKESEEISKAKKEESVKPKEVDENKAKKISEAQVAARKTTEIKKVDAEASNVRKARQATARTTARRATTSARTTSNSTTAKARVTANKTVKENQ